ncbi:MAG: hypothetical protein GX996_11080 [Firmicutes bacterium]|nr:hypothetical protein [Bacillota bacterium]
MGKRRCQRVLIRFNPSGPAKAEIRGHRNGTIHLQGTAGGVASNRSFSIDGHDYVGRVNSTDSVTAGSASRIRRATGGSELFRAFLF